MQDEDGFLWCKSKRPIVLFPEGTKTNGLGVLNIDEGVIKLIDEAAHLDSNLRVHAVRFDHQFAYYSPINTTEYSGLHNFLGTIAQFSSRYTVQYYFNLEGMLYNDCKTAQQKSDFVKTVLMTRRKEQMMKNLDWRDHREFLKYWNKTKTVEDYEKL